MELDQWQIIEDLRTRAPENEGELARKVADLLEAWAARKKRFARPGAKRPGV